jgi:hypothetical protein
MGAKCNTRVVWLVLLNIQNKLAIVATRSRYSKFSTHHEPTGRTIDTKNPINPTKRLSHESQQGGVWCQLSPRSSAIRIVAGYAGRKGRDKSWVPLLLPSGGDGSLDGRCSGFEDRLWVVEQLMMFTMSVKRRYRRS